MPGARGTERNLGRYGAGRMQDVFGHCLVLGRQGGLLAHWCWRWMAGWRDGLMMCLPFSVWAGSRNKSGRAACVPPGLSKAVSSHFFDAVVSLAAARPGTVTRISPAPPRIYHVVVILLVRPRCVRRRCGFQRVEPASRPVRRSLGRKDGQH